MIPGEYVQNTRVYQDRLGDFHLVDEEYMRRMQKAIDRFATAYVAVRTPHVRNWQCDDIYSSERNLRNILQELPASMVYNVVDAFVEAMAFDHKFSSHDIEETVERMYQNLAALRDGKPRYELPFTRMSRYR
jgi:hypothetical protein